MVEALSFISGSRMILSMAACSFSTIGFGVAAGANSICHDTASKPGALAASANGGMSGSDGIRVEADTASARSLPSRISGNDAPVSAKPSCTWPAMMSVIDCGVLR
jgi:hypothetical protein